MGLSRGNGNRLPRVRTARPQPAGPPLRAAATRVRSSGLDAALALAAWFGLIVAGRLLVEPLNQSDPFVHVANAPLVGRYDPSTTWLIVPPLLLGIAAVAWGPMLAERLSFRSLLLAAGGGAFAWPFLLAMSDGPQRVIDPLVTRYELLHDVPFAVTQHDFLGTFTALAAGYDFHVHAHPPLLLMVFMGLHEIGLAGGWPAAVVVLAVGALAAPAAVAATRAVAGEPFARAAAPFLVFAPAAVWIGTSTDAFYMGLAAVGVALFAVAASRPAGGWADAGSLAGGVVLGAALFTTYGIVPMGLIVLAITVYRRAWRVAGAGRGRAGRGVPGLLRPRLLLVRRSADGARASAGGRVRASALPGVPGGQPGRVRARRRPRRRRRARAAAPAWRVGAVRRRARRPAGSPTSPGTRAARPSGCGFRSRRGCCSLRAPHRAACAAARGGLRFR